MKFINISIQYVVNDNTHEAVPHPVDSCSLYSRGVKLILAHEQQTAQFDLKRATPMKAMFKFNEPLTYKTGDQSYFNNIYFFTHSIHCHCQSIKMYASQWIFFMVHRSWDPPWKERNYSAFCLIKLKFFAISTLLKVFPTLWRPCFGPLTGCLRFLFQR